MAGSKRGERRGGAKPGHIRKRPAATKSVSNAALKNRGFGSGAGRAKGTGNKSKFDPQLGVILNKQVSPLKREQELEMYFTVVGKRMRLPREVMLDAMRYFEETGIDYGEVLRANLAAAAAATTPEAREVYGQAVIEAENRMREYITMAVDVAYKAAPYIHPRLAAFITKPGSDGAPADILSLLMRDLDEAGRPARYIDHDPNEVTK